MLVKDLLSEISSLPYHRLNQTNVSEVRLSPNGDIFLVTSQEEIGSLKDSIRDNEKVIKELEEENKELDRKYDDLEAEHESLKRIISEIKDGELSLSELLKQKNETEAENQQLRHSISEWVKVHKKLSSEIEKLRARKNKASVSRCIKAGGLIAEFSGKKYRLVEILPEILPEIPAEKA